MLSIVFKQPCGSMKAELQKLTVLVITVFINWSWPVKDNAQCVHDGNFLRI